MSTSELAPSGQQAEAAPPPPLRLVDLSKHFGGIIAVESFNVEIAAGEIVALVGDNGAGKSTLVKCIAGVIAPTSGAIHLSGTRHEFANPAEALEAGVETVYQDLALVESFDLAENLFLGRELVRSGWLARFGILRKRDMERTAREAIARRPASATPIQFGDGVLMLAPAAP